MEISLKDYSTDYPREFFHGIYAATVNPMLENYALDEGVLCEHVAAVAGVAGIRGLLINGHAITPAGQQLDATATTHAVCHGAITPHGDPK